MKLKAMGFTGWALAVFAAIGVLLLGMILHLADRARDQEDQFIRAKDEYDLLIKLRLRYRDQEVKLKNVLPESNGQDVKISWQAFLEQKAREAGLPALNIREEAARGPLKERSFTVNVNAAAGSAISRKQFIKFLDLVEAQRPSFKSKNISFKFQAASPDDLQTATATFSDYSERQ